MSLRFQRLILILITLVLLGAALLLILFNTKQNIIFFLTPTELLEKKILPNQQIRIGGYVKNKSFKKKLSNKYEFKITDNENEILVIYTGILPDIFKEGQGAVVEGLLDKNNNIVASKVYAKHDENYMPASIQNKLEENNQWKKKYK